MKSWLHFFSPPIRQSQPCLLSDFDIALSASSSSFDDLLSLCLLSLGFAGLHRLGEITDPNRSSLRDHCKRILYLSLSISSTSTYFEYNLPYSKVNQNFIGQNIIIYSNPHKPACAVHHLFNYISLRDPTFPAHTPLFIPSHGFVPTRSWFLRRFRPLFDSSKTGHSLRSGGATYLANRGVSFDLIKEAGRWSSDAFTLYICSNPILCLPSALASAASSALLPGTQVSFAPLGLLSHSQSMTQTNPMLPSPASTVLPTSSPFPYDDDFQIRMQHILSLPFRMFSFLHTVIASERSYPFLHHSPFLYPLRWWLVVCY